VGEINAAQRVPAAMRQMPPPVVAQVRGIDREMSKTTPLELSDMGPTRRASGRASI
jgi:hypothetical protein